VLSPPEGSDTWLGLSADPLPSAAIAKWVVLPSCGAVVQFSGTARDHAAGRPGVDLLEYEAYDEQVIPRLRALGDEIRRRWSSVGRLVLVHRIGPVRLTEAAVIVAVSAPHRSAAFDAARFGIDALKSTVPIWKRERWDGGQSWGLEAQHIAELGTAGAGASGVSGVAVVT